MQDRADEGKAAVIMQEVARPIQGRSPAACDVEASDGPLLTALVVAETLDSGVLLQTALASVGLGAVAVAAGDAVFDHIRSRPPRCIILDDAVPTAGGLALLRRLLDAGASATHGAIPVVVWGSDPDAEAARAYLKAGAADYLVNSRCTPMDLRQAVEAEAARVTIEQRSDAETLSASQAGLELAFEHTRIAQAILDANLCVLRVNRAAASVTGLPPEAHVGKSAWELAPSFRETNEPKLRHVLTTGQTLEEEVTGESPSAPGQTRFWKLTIYPIRQSNGSVVAVGVSIDDITARKQAEGAIIDSEDRYRRALLTGGLGTWETDFVNGIRSWTAEGLALFGLELPTRTEVLGGVEDSLLGILHPDDRHLLEHYHLRAQTEDHFPAEYRIVRPDIGVRWIAGRASVLSRSADGRPGKVVHIAQDVTERKEAEAQLRTAHDTFRHLVENSPFGIYTVDADFRLAQVSAGAQKTFATVYPLIGRDFAEVMRTVWPEPAATDYIGQFRNTLATGQPYRAPAHIERRADIDETESYDWSIERVTMPDGRFGVVCHFYDLSERQKFEAALSESEATFRAMFDISSVAKVEADPETGRFLRVNHAMCDLVGFSEAELLALSFIDITHAEDREEERQAYRQLLLGELAVFDRDKRYVCKDGRVIWARTTINVVRDLQGRPLRNSAIVQDFTARRRAEQALRASEEKFRTFFDTAQEGIWAIDRDGKTLDVNPRLAKMLGTTREALAGKPASDFHFPDDFLHLKNRIAANLAGETQDFETRFRRVDGTAVHVLAATAPLRGSDGEVIGALGGFLDLSGRRRSEERQHMLMRELAHRSKNLLAVIQSITGRTLTGDRTLAEGRDVLAGRLRALANTYGTLTDEAFEGAPLEEIVSTELAIFGGRTNAGGPRMMLTARVSQTMALVVHELATNAAKYGALSNPGGQVEVVWRIVGAGEDRRFVFEWNETGGPPVDPPQRRGFGYTLVTTVAGAELRCTPTLDFAHAGARYRFESPLSVVGAVMDDSPVRRKVQSEALMDLYDVWASRVGPDGRLPDWRQFDRARFEASGSLTVAEVDAAQDLNFIVVGRTLNGWRGRRSFDDGRESEDRDSMAEAYRRCARSRVPSYETLRFDFGSGEIVTFERLLVPFSGDGLTVSHIAGLASFHGKM